MDKIDKIHYYFNYLELVGVDNLNTLKVRSNRSYREVNSNI